MSISAFFKALKQKRQHAETQKEPQTNHDEVPTFDTALREIKATVVEQACGVKMVGIKTPKTVKEFLVVFRTETGELLKFDVPEEMYDGFEKGQTGTLTVSAGQVYGFSLDEGP